MLNYTETMLLYKTDQTTALGLVKWAGEESPDIGPPFWLERA